MMPTLTQLADLAHLAERREYAVLLEWLTQESAKLTREAISTADAHRCGAATWAQTLITLLANVQELHRSAKTSGSPTIF